MQRSSINKDCRNCSLSNGAIAGIGPDDLTKVRLIVIGDYPGKMEKEVDVPFTSNDSQRIPRRLKSGVTSMLKPRNGGSLMRMMLNNMGIDPYTECWFTYAIKCNPAQNKPKEKQAKTCVKSWLIEELSMLDKYCPTVPILIAGNVAFKSLSLTFRDSDIYKKTLKDCRRTNKYKLFSHPLFFTFSPGSVCRSEWGVEDTCIIYKNRVQVTSKEILPSLPLSPMYIYQKDMDVLDEYFNPDKYKIEEEDLF